MDEYSNHKIIANLKKLSKISEGYHLEREKNQLKEAGYFNSLRFLRTDENGLSSIIAFLLDPKEKHGQQDLFLNSFLKLINKPEYLAYDRAVIRTEMPTSKKRRHDIFIEGWIKNERKWIISIENKLRWASDQNQQLKDYKEDLKRYSPCPFTLIYLTVFGNTPSEISISEESWTNLGNNAKLLSATNLIEWLDKTPIVAPRILQFSEDVKNFLREDIMGISKNSNELVNQIILDGDLLEASLNVINHKEVIFEQLVSNLVEQLNKKFESNFYNLNKKGWRIYSSSNPCDKYFGIFYGKNSEEENWGIGLEFDSKNNKNAYFGVWANKDNISDTNYKILSDVFQNMEDCKSTGYWLKWKYCDNNLRDWNTETWKGVLDGSLAEQIFQLLAPIAELANDNIEKLEF
ncbi:Uncharacterised protein [Canicola haemoglobinophilus]|uniref:PD-(D/E)XK nuclease family protein n=1 Tax=Canicola haemoglobinophilus TaxID=733 RepID=A0AB38HBG1_9PAST|nr:PD-(D/E)XK nuclease family protein [Canicola haemoglobinophilus]STO54088.1 Uncharacterised protein [Canicola haemoglobinophilus]STO68621.1 Uncharacterised protein [Canicola haemoglobinophilus]